MYRGGEGSFLLFLSGNRSFTSKNFLFPRNLVALRLLFSYSLCPLSPLFSSRAKEEGKKVSQINCFRSQNAAFVLSNLDRLREKSFFSPAAAAKPTKVENIQVGRTDGGPTDLGGIKEKGEIFSLSFFRKSIGFFKGTFNGFRRFHSPSTSNTRVFSPQEGINFSFFEVEQKFFVRKIAEISGCDVSGSVAVKYNHQ